MKMKLLTAFLFLTVTSTQVLARPSIGAMNQKLDILISVLVVCPSNAPTRFVDNGDGTICDRDTGLMWEMKDASDGTQDLNNPNDVDNTYTWTSTGAPLYPPDGTVFTDFLARLNGEVDNDGRTVQLGGHSDWRLPTVWELQTILDCSFGSPCIDPIFAPQNVNCCWSGTEYGAPGGVSALIFAYTFGGFTQSTQKQSLLRVRAVRGGR